MTKIIDINGITYYVVHKNNVPTINTTSNYSFEETRQLGLSDNEIQDIFINCTPIFAYHIINKKQRIEEEYTFDLGYKVHGLYTIEVDAKQKIINSTVMIDGNIGAGVPFTRTLNNYGFSTNDIEIKLAPFAYVNDENNITALVFMLLAKTEYQIFGTLSLAYGVVFGVDYNGISPNAEDVVSVRELDVTNNTQEGGGYGTGIMPHDNINIPELPKISLTDTGSTLYYLTSTIMRQFSRWLWTSDWQDNIKKIRTDPMQNIIGVSIIDVPLVGSNETINIGNIDTNIQANKAPSFIEVDCGTITLDEYYGTFADYEPFVATTLYLPKVGFVQIPADVCVNNSIKVVYHIELSSGEGLCYVYLTSKRDGFSYVWNTYTCHVTSNITLSAQDHSQQLVALGNAIINTGISASNAIINPASAAQGLTNTLSSCIDVATTKNPTSTKGNVGNMSAVMCYKKPYLLINRTNLTKPSSFQENNGYLINYTSIIGGHTGFLQTRNYHCSFNAPYNHRAEIERLMDGGVIINA